MLSSFWLLQNRGEHRQTWAAVIPLWRRRLDLRHPFLLLALLPVPSSFSSRPAVHLLRWHRSHGPAGRDSVRTAPSTRTPSIPLETNTCTHTENTHQQRAWERVCVLSAITWRPVHFRLHFLVLKAQSVKVGWDGISKNKYTGVLNFICIMSGIHFWVGSLNSSPHIYRGPGHGPAHRFLHRHQSLYKMQDQVGTSEKQGLTSGWLFTDGIRWWEKDVWTLKSPAPCRARAI